MSITPQDNPAGGAPGSIVLPAGAQVVQARETTQTNGFGQVTQGMLFAVKLSNNATTTVFIPYEDLTNTSKVQAVFDERLNALAGIIGS